MSTMITDPDAILSICKEVLEKTKNMHNALKFNYIVITDDGCDNAYNYFLLPFESTLCIAEKIKKEQLEISSDIMYSIIFRDYRVKIILKINSEHDEINVLPIYTSKENGERVFIIDRERKTVSKPSIATFVDTPFDLMLAIVMNGIRAILKNFNYVTDSEILEYAKKHSKDNGRDGDIAKRILDIIGGRINAQ